MSIVPWKFYDPTTTETYIFPINPNQMSSPEPKRAFDSGEAIDEKMHVVSDRAYIDWQFSGILHSEAQYNAFVNWRHRKYPIVVTDHFNRKMVMVPTSFEPADTRSSLRPWRHTYVFKGRVIPADFLSSVDLGWLV